jgi:hypothetical protein
MRANFLIRFSGIRIGLVITAAIDRLHESNGARSVALKPGQTAATLGARKDSGAGSKSGVVGIVTRKE